MQRRPPAGSLPQATGGEDQGRGAAGDGQYGRNPSNGAKIVCSHHKSVTGSRRYGNSTVIIASRRAVRPVRSSATTARTQAPGLSFLSASEVRQRTIGSAPGARRITVSAFPSGNGRHDDGSGGRPAAASPGAIQSRRGAEAPAARPKSPAAQSRTAGGRGRE